MARAIPKREWLEVEEDLCRTAFLEFLVDQCLWELPLSAGSDESAGSVSLARPSGSSRRDPVHLVIAIQALQDFGWFQEPGSSASH